MSIYFMFFSREKTIQNKLFGVLLLLLCVRVCKSVLWWFYPEISFFIIKIGICACFLIGPVFFSYVKVVKSRLSHISKTWYFTLLMHLIIIFLLLLFSPGRHGIEIWKVYIIPIVYIYWVVMVLLSGFLLRDEMVALFKKERLDFSVKWLLSLYFSLLLIVFIYLLSFKGYTAIVYIVSPIIFTLIVYINLMFFLRRNNIESLQLNSVKYSFKIDAEAAALTFQNLNHLFETELLYDRPNLRISDVACKLGLSSHHISQVLNDNYGISFPEYVNQFRVKRAKEIIESSCDKLKLEAIGNLVGFRSKASFYASFKKNTGMTPNQYRATL